MQNIFRDARAIHNVSMPSAEFIALVFPANQNAHVKAWHIHHRLAMFTAASDAMADGIKRCGSVAAWLKESQRCSP